MTTSITYLKQDALTLGSDAPPLIGFTAPDLSGISGLTALYMLGSGGFGQDEQLRNIADDGATYNLSRIGDTPETDEVYANLYSGAGFDTGISETEEMTFVVAMIGTTSTDTMVPVVAGDGETSLSALALWAYNSSFRGGCYDGSGTYRQANREFPSLDTSKPFVGVVSFATDGLTVGVIKGDYLDEVSVSFTGRTLSGETILLGSCNWGGSFNDTPAPVAEIAIYNTQLSATDREAAAFAMVDHLNSCGYETN